MSICVSLRCLGFAGVLGLAFSTPVAAAPETGADVKAAISQAATEPLDKLIHDVEHAHPVAMILLAKRLFDAGRRDEAVFWFYEGQVRWRALLAADPTRSEGHTGMLSETERDQFGRLFRAINLDINHYAVADLPALLKTYDRVLEWDASHPDDFTPNGEAKDRARRDMKDLSAYAVAHQDELRKAGDEARREIAAQAKDGDPYSGNGGMHMGAPKELVRAYDPTAFAGFRVRSTTKADVVRALGGPEWWSTYPDGKSSIGYSYFRGNTGLSIIGMVERVQVSFTFDATRMLVEIDLPRDFAAK